MCTVLKCTSGNYTVPINKILHCSVHRVQGLDKEYFLEWAVYITFIELCDTVRIYMFCTYWRHNGRNKLYYKL